MIKKVSILSLAVVFLLISGLMTNSVISAEIAEYVGYSEADDHGYIRAEVVLEGDTIIDVKLTEYSELGEAKGEDYSYDEYHEAMVELPERFIDANSHEIDVFSGATSSSNKAMEAVKMALDKADDKTEFNGTYMGTSAPSDRGAYGVAWVEVKEGEIVDVKLEEVSEGEFKDEDYDYEDFHNAKEELPQSFIDADSYDIDTYSGATGSSDRWRQAVIRALGKAGF